MARWARWKVLLNVGFAVSRYLQPRVASSLQPGRLTGVCARGWDAAAAVHMALYSGRQNQSTVKLTTADGAENWANTEVVSLWFSLSHFSKQGSVPTLQGEKCICALQELWISTIIFLNWNPYQIFPRKMTIQKSCSYSPKRPEVQTLRMAEGRTTLPRPLSVRQKWEENFPVPGYEATQKSPANNPSGV